MLRLDLMKYEIHYSFHIVAQKLFRIFGMFITNVYVGSVGISGYDDKNH